MEELKGRKGEERERIKSASTRPRSLSPGFRGGSDVDQTKEVYREGMRKLIEASWRFNKEKDGNFLKTIENRELDKEGFRQSIRLAMDCRLSAQELDAIQPHFRNSKNDNLVDGCEFILLFYRVRYEYRSKLLTERIARETRIREAMKELEARRKQEIETKAASKISFKFSEDDLKTAMEKVTEAAVKYDRHAPGAVQLDAFDCEYMEPVVFKEQLKRAFNMNLHPGELGALIKHLAKEGEEVINCAQFLVIFFRIGFTERASRMRAKFEEKRRINEEKVKKRKEDMDEQEHRNSLKCSLDFETKDKESAMLKLRTAARLYDKSAPGAMSMQSFEVASMAPHVFKEQLKRVLNLKTTPAELGALVSIFGNPSAGSTSQISIHCKEFAKTFLALGFSERDKEAKEALERQRKADEARKAEWDRKQKELVNKNAMKFSFEYSEEDLKSAMVKLQEAAWRYDKSMPGAANLEAFNAQFMEPHIFKEQAKRAFDMVLTPPELGAVMKFFGADEQNGGRIVCRDFCNRFLRMGIEQRHKLKNRQLKMNKEQNELRIKEMEDLLKAQEEKVLLKSDQKFTEDDFKSALAKLTVAATKFDKTMPGTPNLTAFEAISMPPHVFKEQLKLAFNVKISMEELSALMSYFDKEGAGEINCKDFLIQFTRTGLDERARIRKEQRHEDRAQKAKLEQDELDRLRQQEAKAEKEVDFDFGEEDFDSALMKLILMCHNFDKRQLGPGGFSAFTSESLTPSEFREMTKRTFSLKVNQRELGALVTYFDVKSKGAVNCNQFLQSFVQIRVASEPFKGTKDEEEKLQEYHSKLKDSYRLRIQRQLECGDDGKAIKPWTSSSILNAKGGGGRASLSVSKSLVKKKKKKLFPKSPIDKIKLRIAVGKVLGRVDLSTKILWPEKNCDKTKNSRLNQIINRLDLNSHLDIVHDASTIHADFLLEEIPEEIFKLSNITELWLCQNNITSIPPQIADLKGLTTLSLTHNGLETIPPEVCLLENLQRFFLSGNNISVLPDSFGRLRQLLQLELAHNEIYIFPQSICSLFNLESLDLSQNKIKRVPDELKNLRKLTKLNLDHNQGMPYRPQNVFNFMHWLHVTGVTLPEGGEKKSQRFKVSLSEEVELETMLKNRAKFIKRGGKRRLKKKKGDEETNHLSMADITKAEMMET